MNKIILLLIVVFKITNAQVTQKERAEQMRLMTDYVRGATGILLHILMKEVQLLLLYLQLK